MRPPGFPDGGGAVGALMRGNDWSSSPLGAPEAWPQSLRSVVGLLLNSKFPMFVAWGPELGFLYNDAYAEILGAKHPRSLGARFHDIWSEIWSDISPLIDAAMAGQASFSEDLPLVMNRKGFDEQTWFTFSYSPVRDESGAVAGLFCAVSETTQRILAERALREGEGLLRAMNETLEQRVAEALAERKIFADLFEGTDAYVQVADMDYRWLAINRAARNEFERIFGVRPRLGDSMLDLLAGQPEHRAALEAIWSRALAGEEFTEVREFGDATRSRRAYEIKFNTLRDRAGRQIGAFQFVIDVTERVTAQKRLAEAEEFLHQSRKMETIGQLTGGVAHDFNNLLTPIVVALDQLRRRHDDNERDRRLIVGAQRAAERAGTLVQRLLAFSRRQHLQPRAVDIGGLVEGMADLMSRSLGAGIELVFDMADDLMPAQVDPNQLELALLNLAVNARDAMSGRGRLTITANAHTADGHHHLAAGAYIRLSVSDTGTGMDEDTLRRATEPFFTTKGIGEGTGLGLSAVQGLAEQSGGAFRLDSKLGRGTTATLLLPASEREVVEEIRESEPVALPVFAGTRAVLLVDDEELVRAGIAEMLREVGYQVMEVGSAYQALDLLNDGLKVDVLITDYAMPGMTGVELAREARSLKPTLLVLLITGYAAVSDREAGGLARLAKPFGQARLVAAVDELFKAHDRAILGQSPHMPA
ncbi:MAG TPA: PAS domain-containing protein [Acetobacteraceae bacterium]|nr:PAS domain-containing protein [Acetobacteraceae bacterium]